MKLAKLKSIVKTGESNLLEFKSSLAGLSGGMKTVCAFLNSSHGGTVIFGVQDNGHIVGQIINDKNKQDIGVEIKKIEPYAKIDITYIKLPSKQTVIVFIVKPGDEIPYFYDGKPYNRFSSTTTRMSTEELINLLNKHNPTNWEALPHPSCTIKDLDRDRIQEVVKLAIHENRLKPSDIADSISAILKKLKLVIGNKINNAGVVLFCKNSIKQLVQSNIKLARFAGTDKSEFLDQKSYQGNALELYDKALDFLYFSLPVAAKIEEGNPNRVETPLIPYKVLREAIANAIVHRDYSNPGGSISVAIYDNRVTISNTGSLPKGIKLSQLSKEHDSVLRNPHIANVFYICGKIEKWGRGTVDMIQECKKAGNPDPKFDETENGFSVTFPYKTPIRQSAYFQIRDEPRFTARQKEIIAILQQAPHTRQELMTSMSTSVTDRTIQLELSKLKKMNSIKSEGKGKATVWHIVKK